MHNPINCFPEGGVRGVILNLADGPILPIPDIKRQLDIYAGERFNFVVLALNDVFSCSKHPAVGWKYDTMSPETFVELDAYAKDLSINLVPRFNSLDMHHKLLSLSEYLDLAEYPGAGSFALSNGNRYSVLRDYYSEILACFSSNLIDVSINSSNSQELFRSRHLLSTHSSAELLAQHTSKVSQIVKENGGIALISSEILLNSVNLCNKVLGNGLILHKVDPSSPRRKIVKQLQKIDLFMKPVLLVVPPSYSEKKIRLLLTKNPCVYGYIVDKNSEKNVTLKDINPVELELTSPHFLSAKLRYDEFRLHHFHPIWSGDDTIRTDPMYFRKNFTNIGLKSRVFISAHCSNFMRIFVNGIYIGDIMHLESNTEESIFNSLGVFDITEVIQHKDITIGIEAYFYSGQSKYIFLELFIDDDLSGEKKHRPLGASDSLWVFSTTPQPTLDWTLPEYDLSVWTTIQGYE